MRKHIYIIGLLALLITFHSGHCQSIGGWQKVDETLKFHAADLYGRIDGGAELFLEFGFEELTVDAYKMGEVEIELELYRMTLPESALGIYLLKCGQEKPSHLIEARNTFSKYQVTALKNNYFIQLNNFSGKMDYWSDMVELLNQYLENIPAGDSIKIFDLLPKENLVEGSEKLIRGQYGLQPIYTLGQGDILQLQDQTFAIVAQYHDADDSLYTRIYVPYADDKTADKAFKNIQKNMDSYIETLESDDSSIVFKDYRKRFEVVKLRDNIIDINVNLRQEPKKTISK